MIVNDILLVASLQSCNGGVNLISFVLQIWDRNNLECVQVLTGHTGSVLCLQYDENIIISGSSDSTVRVWSVKTGEMLNTLIHHCEAVLHLRFCDGIMVTCSKVSFLPLSH